MEIYVWLRSTGFQPVILSDCQARVAVAQVVAAQRQLRLAGRWLGVVL